MRLKFLGGAALVAALGVAHAARLRAARRARSTRRDGSRRLRQPEREDRADKCPARPRRSASWAKRACGGTDSGRRRRSCGTASSWHAASAGRPPPRPARWYLNRHKALFGLRSLDGLELESANRLRGSNGYAVNFRQVFRRARRVESGSSRSASTGARRAAGRSRYVSSSLTRATSARRARQALGRRRLGSRRPRASRLTPLGRERPQPEADAAVGRSSASPARRAPRR